MHPEIAKTLVAQRQVGGPATVACSLCEPATEVGAWLVGHPGGGHVAQPPSCPVQSHAKIDVLAEAQPGCETVADRRLADHHHRARDVGDRRQRQHRGLTGWVAGLPRAGLAVSRDDDH